MNKSLRKLFSLALALALVFSSGLGVGTLTAQAEETTNKEFTDIANLDAASKEHIEFVTEREIFKGNTDGTFRPYEGLTRRHAAMVLVRALDLKVGDKFLGTFTDVKDTDGGKEIEALANAKIISGYKDGTFKPEAFVTRTQFAKMVTNGYELAMGDKKVTLSDIDNLDTDKKFVETVVSNEIVNGYPDGTYRPNNHVLRVHVAKFLTNTIELVEGQELVVTSVNAINVNEIEVTFNKAVDTKKANVQVKKGAAIYSTDVKWNEAGDTATVKTVINLPKGDYTVVVTGLTEKPLENKFSVEAETATTIEVTAKTIDDNTAEAQVAFVVKNQYGADMKVKADATGLVVSAYNVTQGKSVTPEKNANQYFTVNTKTNENDFKVGDEIRFTLTYKGMTTQAIVKVADPSSSANIEFGDIVLAKDDLRLNVSDVTFKLNYTLIDQYGKATDLKATAQCTLPQEIDGVQFISSNPAVINKIAVIDNKDGYGEIVLSIAGEGTTTLTAVVNESGAVATKQITVEKDSEATAVAIAAPTMLVAAGDKAFDLNLVITDQYGDVLKKTDGVTFELKLGDTTPDVLKANATDGVTTLNVDLSGLKKDSEITKTTKATITAKADDKTLGTVTFDVEPNAKAQQIKSTSIPKLFEKGASHNVVAKDLNVVDQYGREFKGDITVTEVTDADNAFSVTKTEITADSIGKAKYKVRVGTAEFEFEVKAIESKDVKNYTIDDVKAISSKGSDGSHDVAVTISGVNADGNAVVLKENAPDFITSNNPSVAIVHNDTAIRGVKAGTATISAWKDGKVVATTTVTVTDEALVATSVEIAATAAKTDELSKLVTVKDQFGVEIVDKGYYFVGDEKAVSTDKLSKDSTVKYVTSNGIMETVKVTVTL